MSTKALAKVEDASLVLSTALPMDRNPAAVYLAGLAPGSRRTMRGDLEKIARLLSGGMAGALELEWGKLRFAHAAAVRSRLAESYAPRTASRMLSALRGVLGAAFELGQIPPTFYQKAIRVRGIRGERLPAGRALTAGEVAAVFGACAGDPGPAGVRDAAILALLRCMLRRAEIAGATVADVDLPAGVIRVLGKGNKQRAVPFPAGVGAALADWLTLRGDAAGPLFSQVNKSGRLIAAGITAQAVYDVLRRRCAEARVADCSPHDWRRTGIGDLLDAGVDLAVVAKIAGHASVNTTAGYDRRPESAKRDAMNRLHIPYTRKTLPVGP